MAAGDAAKEAVWLRLLAEDLGFRQENPTILYEDNNGCIAQTENPLHHKRTKHIDVSYHYTKQLVEDNVVVLHKIDTSDQLADMMMKPLGAPTLNKHLAELSMRDTTVVVLK